MPDDPVPRRTDCSDTDGAEGDLRYDTCVGETRERDYQEDLPEEEPRSLQEQERSNIVLVSITKMLQEAKRIDTGGRNACIQGLHGDYIVIF